MNVPMKYCMTILDARMKFFDLDHEETAAKERRRINGEVVIIDL
jgi:hypothetical protein